MTALTFDANNFRIIDITRRQIFAKYTLGDLSNLIKLRCFSFEASGWNDLISTGKGLIKTMKFLIILSRLPTRGIDRYRHCIGYLFFQYYCCNNNIYIPYIS